MGSIIAFFVSVWFYLSAQKVKKNGLQWAVIGFVSYFVALRIWRYFIVAPMFVHNTSSPAMTMVITSTPAIVGLITALLIWIFFLRKA